MQILLFMKLIIRTTTWKVLSRASFKLKHIVTLNTLFLNSFTNYVFHNTVCCQRDFYERSNDSLCSLPKYNFHLFLFLHGNLNFCAIQFYCVPLIVDSYETVACWYNGNWMRALDPPMTLYFCREQFTHFLCHIAQCVICASLCCSIYI